jgi:phage gpG-like protein
MTSSIDATVVNLKEVTEYIKSIPAESFDIFKEELAKTLLSADADVKKNTDIETRSGKLMQSITTELTGTDFSNLKASIYTNCIYAPIHEYGGTVRAKKAYLKVPGGPYLNIPTNENKTPAGVMRLGAKEVFNRGGYIAKAGKHYGVFLNGQMMFTLVSSVTVPPRLHMITSVEGEIPTFLSRMASRLEQL